MKRKLFSALLCLAAVVGIACINPPTVVVSPNHLNVVPNIPFYITAVYTNTDIFVVIMEEEGHGEGFEFLIDESTKNQPTENSLIITGKMTNPNSTRYYTCIVECEDGCTEARALCVCSTN